jgi:hypothetical protein
MRTFRLETGESRVDFEQARRLAGALADSVLGESVCLSWSDRKAGRESPSHASDCHGSCETPGYVEYALTRGASLRVILDGGAFDFLFRPLGEFAPAPPE